jgi:hypothetical protein
MILRCYTSKDDDVHIACCLDLCLCAQEDSVEKVKTKLRCMIDEYVEEAYTVELMGAQAVLQKTYQTPKKICKNKYMALETS